MTTATPESHRNRPGPGPGPSQPAIRVIMMPKHTNAYGTIFGGIILSHIDQAGAVEAHRHVSGRLVTVAMREVEFLSPVFVGDLVSFFTETVRIGRTSVTVRVAVEAERRRGAGKVQVTEAEVVYVNVDETNQPTPVVPAEASAEGEASSFALLRLSRPPDGRRLGGGEHLVAGAAARLVGLAVPHLDLLATAGGALAVVGGGAATHAHRVHLVDELGARQKLGHRAERPAQVIEVEAGDHHPDPAIGQGVDHGHDPDVEELGLVDPHHLDVVVEPFEQRVRVLHGHRVELPVVARHQPLGGIAGVGHRLEDLDVLAGDGGAAQPPHELLALAREHAPGDHLHPSARAIVRSDRARHGRRSYRSARRITVARPRRRRRSPRR